MRRGKPPQGCQGRIRLRLPSVFGQRSLDRQLVADDGEQAVISRIRELRAAGVSLRQMADALNTEGLPSKRGGQWHPETLRRVVARL